MKILGAVRLICLSFTALLASTLLFAQTPRQQVENLRAFAKAYGYVKYFNPSDESAQIDWERFAAYGAEKVKSAKNSRELQTVLSELFAPIGPTLQIYRQGETAHLPMLTFTHDKDVVAWQHYGNGIDTERANPRYSKYRSIRTNRKERPSVSAIGPATQTLDAKPYAGMKIKLSADIRVAAPVGQGSAYLWLRVDRADRSAGFSDNMENRPVVVDSWKRYEILGEVAMNADRIAFGVMLKGRGKAWFDRVQLHFEKDGQWVEIPLPDSDFEKAQEGQIPEGWVNGNPGQYEVQAVKGGASSGQQALLIQEKEFQVTQVIFAMLPKAGDMVRKELTPDLFITFPLALPKDLKTDDANLAALNQVLFGRPRATADQQAVRLGNVVMTWNVFQHFYPYFDEVKVDWDKALTTALEAALKDATPMDHWVTLKKLVAKLKDGHGVVSFNDPKAGDLPGRFDWIEERLVVTATKDAKIFQRGDVILNVDGHSGAELLQEAESQVSGSDALRRHRALNTVGFGPVDEVAKVVVQRGEQRLSIDVKRVKRFGGLFFKDLYEFNHAAFQDLGDGIYYINEAALDKARFKELLPTLAMAKGVIIDQRRMGYAKDPWDKSELIPFLAKEPFTSARWNVPQIAFPDQEKVTFDESRWPLKSPQTPHIGARVLIINVPSAVSYDESIMGIYEHYKLAEFVGEPTAGCNGNANFNVLPGGYRIMWTGMKVLKHDGAQHHLVGIQPTHPVKRTLNALNEGRDEYLEKAVTLLKGR